MYDYTEVPDDNTQHQNDDDTSDDAGTPTTVSADAAVDFCELDKFNKCVSNMFLLKFCQVNFE